MIVAGTKAPTLAGMEEEEEGWEKRGGTINPSLGDSGQKPGQIAALPLLGFGSLVIMYLLATVLSRKASPSMWSSKKNIN